MYHSHSLNPRAAQEMAREIALDSIHRRNAQLVAALERRSQEQRADARHAAATLLDRR